MNQTLTLKAGLTDDLIVEFIKQCIPLYNIKDISNEPKIVENEINIERSSYESCVEILYKIRQSTGANVTIKNENKDNVNVIVLFQ